MAQLMFWGGSLTMDCLSNRVSHSRAPHQPVCAVLFFVGLLFPMMLPGNWLWLEWMDSYFPLSPSPAAMRRDACQSLAILS